MILMQGARNSLFFGCLRQLLPFFPKDFGGLPSKTFFSGKTKAHKHKPFCPVGLGTTPGLSRGFHRVCPWDKFGENPANPGLSLGQTRGRRAAQKVYVKKGYVPFSLAILGGSFPCIYQNNKEKKIRVDTDSESLAHSFLRCLLSTAPLPSSFPKTLSFLEPQNLFAVAEWQLSGLWALGRVWRGFTTHEKGPSLKMACKNRSERGARKW